MYTIYTYAHKVLQELLMFNIILLDTSYYLNVIVCKFLIGNTHTVCTYVVNFTATYMHMPLDFRYYKVTLIIC